MSTEAGGLDCHMGAASRSGCPTQVTVRVEQVHQWHRAVLPTGAALPAGPWETVHVAPTDEGLREGQGVAVPGKALQSSALCPHQKHHCPGVRCQLARSRGHEARTVLGVPLTPITQQDSGVTVAGLCPACRPQGTHSGHRAGLGSGTR